MGSTYFSKRVPFRTVVRSERSRPKTFKSEKAAKAWAEKQGMKDYKLVNMKNTESTTNKIKVVAK